MRKTVKISAIGAMLFLMLCAAIFVYASSRNTLNADYYDDQNTHAQNMEALWESGNCTNDCMIPDHIMHMPPGEANGLPWLKRFLRNVTLSTVQGTIVTQYKDILILNTDVGQIRVLLPKEWTKGNEIVNRATLFNSTFASSGKNVTIKAIKSDVFSNTSFSINIMMGYEAINETGEHAYALLPFNIVPTS